MAKLRNETALSTKSIPIISLRVTTRYVITSSEPFIIPFLIQYLQDHCNKRLFRYRHQIMAKSHRNVIQITIVYFIFRNREQTWMRPIAHAQFCLPWIDHRYNSRYGHGGGTLANLYGRRLRHVYGDYGVRQKSGSMFFEARYLSQFWSRKKAKIW